MFVAITYGKASLWLWKSLENSGNFSSYFVATLLKGFDQILYKYSVPLQLRSYTLFCTTVRCTVSEVRGVKVKVATRSSILVSYCGGQRHPHRCLGVEISSSIFYHIDSVFYFMRILR